MEVLGSLVTFGKATKKGGNDGSYTGEWEKNPETWRLSWVIPVQPKWTGMWMEIRKSWRAFSSSTPNGEDESFTGSMFTMYRDPAVDLHQT